MEDDVKKILEEMLKVQKESFTDITRELREMKVRLNDMMK